ncbi:MAG: putative phage tail protein [Hydrogenoanaerobacterium sp.]
MITTREITLSDRTEGMVNASAINYQESEIFKAIQNSQALEYDRIDLINVDLALQLSPFTATWGLIYWEASVGLIPQPLLPYEKRRPPILARLANEENFGAEMIHKLAANFGEKIRVEIDTAKSFVTVIFQRGVPTFLEEFIEALENIIHAHLGRVYKFEYHINVGIEIMDAYTKYLYSLPLVGSETKCGTLPSVSVYGRLYASGLSMAVGIHNKEQCYKTGGSYAAGPMPFVAIDGRIYPVGVAVEQIVESQEKQYTVSGISESGTSPGVAVEGHIYESETVIGTGERRTEQQYAITGSTDSGTVPGTATEGRQYNADVSAIPKSRSTDEAYKRCNQIYSGGGLIK